MRSTSPVRATVFLQFEPKWNTYRDGDGDFRLLSMRPVRMTLTEPAQRVPGTALVKLTVELPPGVFYPLMPEAVVVVPAEFVPVEPVRVLVETATADGEVTA